MLKILTSNHYILSNDTITTLKNVAFLFMLIDHIGFILLDNNAYFRLIGRAALPIFIFFSTYNFIFNTSSQINTIKRLFILAIISQFFYTYTFNTYTLNIFFLFTVAFTIIYFLQSKLSKYIKFIMISIFVFSSFYIEYSIFGLILILSIYQLLKYPNHKFTYITIFMTIVFMYHYSILFAAITLITFLILIYISTNNINLKSFRFNKYIYYGFYPLHIFILGILSN